VDVPLLRTYAFAAAGDIYLAEWSSFSFGSTRTSV
jgi:hypothetical protein